MRDFTNKLPGDEGIKDFNNIQREYEEARERIGRTTKRAMKWVLGFAQNDLEPLEPSQIALLANEVVVFPTLSVRGWRSRDYPFGWVSVEERDWKIEHGRMWPKRAENKKSLLTLQREVRDYLEHFLAGKSVSAQLSEAVFNVVLMPMPGSGRGIGRFWIAAKKQEQGFILKLLLLIAAHGNQIRRCEGGPCTRMFLANGTRHRFHAKRCQSRIGVQRHRDKLQGKRARRGKQKHAWGPF